MKLREHGSATSPASLRQGSMCARVLRLRCPCGSTLRHHTHKWAAALARPPHEGADRLRALACQFAPATMLVPVRLGLRHHCHSKLRRLSWRGGRDSELSARGTPFRTARRPAPSHRSFATSAAHQMPFAPAYAPFRSARRNIGDTLKVMLAALARFACRVEKMFRRGDPLR